MDMQWGSASPKGKRKSSYPSCHEFLNFMNQSPKLKNGVDLSPPLKGWGAEAGKKGIKAKRLSIKGKRDSNPASNGPAKKRGSAVVR